MTSYEDWLLQVKMKRSYTSEHPLLERKKKERKEKDTSMPTYTRGRITGHRTKESSAKRSQDVVRRTQDLHRHENLNSYLK
jgi:hypothetical protein